MAFSIAMVAILFVQLFTNHLLANRPRRVRMLNFALVCYLTSTSAESLLRLIKAIPVINGYITPLLGKIPVHISDILEIATFCSGILSYILFNFNNKPASFRTIFCLMPVFAHIVATSLNLIKGELPAFIPNTYQEYLHLAYNFLLPFIALNFNDVYVAFNMLGNDYLNKNAMVSYAIIASTLVKLIQNSKAYYNAKKLYASGTNIFETYDDDDDDENENKDIENDYDRDITGLGDVNGDQENTQDL